jgi:Flp pilus assembly pilin Flp
MSGGWETASMGATKCFLARLWSDECGISWFGYALLLALVATGIIVANELSGDGSAIGIDLPFLGDNEGRVFE